MNRLQKAVFCCVAVFVIPSQSAVISLPYEGTVTTASSIANAWGISVGDDAIGSLSFNPTQTFLFPAASTPTASVYVTQNGAPLSFSLNIGGVNFPLSASGLLAYRSLLIGVAMDVVDPSTPPLVPTLGVSADIITFIGFVDVPSVPSFPGSSTFDFRLTLVDYSTSVLTSLAVPSSVDITDFDVAVFSMTDVSLSSLGSRTPALTGIISISETGSLQLTTLAILLAVGAWRTKNAAKAC